MSSIGNWREPIRALRVAARQIVGQEPMVRVDRKVPLELHGSSYGGWRIPSNRIRPDAVVVDVGLGEDISFSQSLVDRYGCQVHGFDPTPRAVAHVQRLAPRNFVLHEYAVAATAGHAVFHLPNNSNHVSGSLTQGEHVGAQSIDVTLITLDDILATLGSNRIDLLKLDIEGSEYEVIASPRFAALAPRIGVLCIEFHHRWPHIGVQATRDAVGQLGRLGFACVWRNATTNEEFTFLQLAGQATSKS